MIPSSPHSPRYSPYVADYQSGGWSIHVQAVARPSGRSIWLVRGRRADGPAFRAAGGSLAEAWKNAALQALDRLEGDEPGTAPAALPEDQGDC